MIIKTLTILSVLFFGFTFQNSKFKLIKSIPANSSVITTDHLGNSYLVNGNVLKKYDSDGNFLKNFSSKFMGDVTFSDASNPLKILLFYKSFQQIILLDNMLAPSGNPISLRALGYNQVLLACTSNNNGFWIYDQQSFELIRFDHVMQKFLQTGNIAQLSGSEINPNFITEQNDKVFLNNPETGILVFDIYGTYNKTIPLKKLHCFQVDNERIVYFEDGKLKSYNMKTLKESETALPATEILDVRIEKEKLYLLKQKSLDIYSVTK